MFLDAWNDTADKDCPLQAGLRKSIDTWLSYLEIQITKGKEKQEFAADLDTRQATFLRSLSKVLASSLKE